MKAGTPFTVARLVDVEGHRVVADELLVVSGADAPGIADEVFLWVLRGHVPAEQAIRAVRLAGVGGQVVRVFEHCHMRVGSSSFNPDLVRWEAWRCEPSDPDGVPVTVLVFGSRQPFGYGQQVVDLYHGVGRFVQQVGCLADVAFAGDRWDFDQPIDGQDLAGVTRRFFDGLYPAAGDQQAVR